MSTGEALRVRAAMKPLSTLVRALDTVDVATGETARAHVQRSDVTAVPAAGVVGEAVVALVLADALLEKTGGDSLAEVRRNLDAYLAGRLTGVNDRPLLKDASDRAGRIRDLLVARGPIYETAGDVAIDTDRHNVEQVAVEVMEWYRRRVGAMAGR